jgi:hypothetical protein
MVWPFTNNEQQQSGVLGLGAQQPAGYGAHPQFGAAQQPAYNGYQQQQPGGFGAFAAGATGQQYNANQPIAPPSELEIVSMLLHHQKPVDQFLMGQNLNMLISIIANIVNLSMVEFFRNAKFKEDDDGKLCVDITSLPTQYQTLSPENVTADLTRLQSACNQTVQQSLMEQQQLLQMAQQSMMQGMLDNAMQDPGMLQAVGSGAGGFVRSVLTGGR